MTALLQRLHARRGDFWCRLKPGCTPNGEMLSYPHAQGTRDALHDGQPDNAGQLRFIDPLIRLKKPAAEVLDHLIGDFST